jgi:hypothetical protein
MSRTQRYDDDAFDTNGILRPGRRVRVGLDMMDQLDAVALKRGREASDARVEESLYRNALAGNTTAQIFWLKNRRPDRWRDVQNINADVGHYIVSDKPMTEEQWIAERTKVIEAKAG